MALASFALAAIKLSALPALNHSIWPSLKEWANGKVYELSVYDHKDGKNE